MHFEFYLTQTAHPDNLPSDPELQGNSALDQAGWVLISALLTAFSRAGYSYEAPELTDAGWISEVRRDETTFQLGAFVGHHGEQRAAGDPIYASAFVAHERSLMQRMLGKNKAATNDRSEADLKAALGTVPGLTDLKEVNFGAFLSPEER
ncbi:MAG: hypothetical protein AAF665_10135 [Pseudomonadota bacterium]